MARHFSPGGFYKPGRHRPGTVGEAGVTLLEVIIALAVTLIFSAGLSASGARTEQRQLTAACLQLQADIREAQERAVLEGVNYIILFSPADGCYRMYKTPFAVDRAVYFDKGVSYEISKGLSSVTFPGKTLTFTPRGTPFAAGTVYLQAGKYKQELTVELASGRTLIKPMH